ncbi:hypothetical protein pb186bvf_021175 [Paramecium bursaria]
MSDIESSDDNFSTELFVKGHNQYGQCGLNLKEIENPQRLILQMIIREIACGANHTLILTNEGLVYGIGDSSKGQLGQEENARIPKLIIQDINCTKIAAGQYHSIAISDSQQAYFWGDGDKEIRQLGAADDVKCGQLFSVFKYNNELQLYQNGNKQQLNVQKFDEYACSATELFILNEGQVFIYGKSMLCEKVTQIFSGYYISVLLDTGVLYYYNNELKKLKSENIVDCSFTKQEGLFLSEQNQLVIYNIDDDVYMEPLIEFHNMSCGVDHYILIGQIIKGVKSDDDSIMESPFTSKNQIPMNQNNTFSFSIRKELKLMQCSATKETQTELEDQNKFKKENEEMRRQIQSMKKNIELQQAQYITLQEQMKKLYYYF